MDLAPPLPLDPFSQIHSRKDCWCPIQAPLLVGSSHNTKRRRRNPIPAQGEALGYRAKAYSKG